MPLILEFCIAISPFNRCEATSDDWRIHQLNGPIYNSITTRPSIIPFFIRSKI